MSPSEIATELGLSRPTAYRLLATMDNRRWVVKSPREPSKYQLGFRILQLAGALLDTLDIRTVAHPFMEQLSQQYDESVRLFIVDDNEVVYIDQVLGSRPLQSFLPLGKRGCLHSKAVGKAILAFMPEDQVAKTIRACGLKAVTRHTITDEKKLKQELARVRELGYGTANQEDVENLRAVGAAILNFQGLPIAGLAISALATHMDDKRMALLGKAVNHTASLISEQLGCTHYGFQKRKLSNNI